MIIILFFLSIVSAIILLIIHSYLTKGGRLTFNFFFFALLWAFRKESVLPFASIAPYEFLAESTLVTLAVFTVTLGWLFTFYISWCISESILRRAAFFKNGLFITLLLCLLVTVSISYAVESTAINIGWWRWKEIGLKFSNFFVPGYHYGAILGWIEFVLFFMAAYFLIECSRYRNAKWKSVFFLIPCIYIWVYSLRDVSMNKVMSFLAIDGLIILAFLNPLELDYEKRRLKTSPKISLAINNLPLFMLIFMVLIVTAIDMLIIKQPQLFFSKMPIIFCILFAIKKIPIIIPVILSIIIIAFGGKLAVPVFILTVFVLFLQITNWLRAKKIDLYNSIMKQHKIDINNTKLKLFFGKIIYFATLLSLIIICHLILNPSHPLVFSRHAQEKIEISGQVIFNEYKSGIIKIGAWSRPTFKKNPPDVARTQIFEPGPFQLTVPKESKPIYLHAINIPKALPFWLKMRQQDFPSGKYENNPLVIKSSDIKEVVIIIK